jgi:HAD superfamily hydrolase (TIGR01490 family)
MRIVFVDFDGTITKSDTLFQFIRFAVGNVKFVMGLLMVSPFLIGYKLKLIPNYRAKEKMLSWFFKGVKKETFSQVATEFSLNHMDAMVRPQAMERLKWHKERDDTVVVVSASIECWLRPWCEREGYALLGTQLAVEGGVLTGRFLTKNCYGAEKVNRIHTAYDVNQFEYIYAYGDSQGDKEMLALADERVYKPFR